MALVVDYVLAPNSPWTYLGHERFVALAKAAGVAVRVRPVNLAQVFPVSGGLPLAQRAPQRQAYRLVELRRWADHLGLPLNTQPAHFPVPPDEAARLITAVDLHDGSDAALALAGAVLRACWAEERDIASTETLAGLVAAVGLPSQRLADATAAPVQARYDENTRYAIDAGVFGAPSYVVDGEIFWGQDRLDFLQRRLARG